MNLELRLALDYRILEQDVSEDGSRIIHRVAVDHESPEVYLNGVSMGYGHAGTKAALAIVFGQPIQHVEYVLPDRPNA